MLSAWHIWYLKSWENRGPLWGPWAPFHLSSWVSCSDLHLCMQQLASVYAVPCICAFSHCICACSDLHFVNHCNHCNHCNPQVKSFPRQCAPGMAWQWGPTLPALSASSCGHLPSLHTQSAKSWTGCWARATRYCPSVHMQSSPGSMPTPFTACSPVC